MLVQISLNNLVMEDFEKIENKIKNMSDYDIVLQKKNPIIPIFITVIGVGLFMLGSSKVVNNDIFEMGTMSIGAIVALYGLVRLMLALQKDAVDYVYKPTKKKLKTHKVYINTADRAKIEQCIECNDFSKIVGMKKEVTSGNMLHLLGTDDGEIFVLQVSEYVPHTFVPASPVVVVRNNDAKSVLEFVNRK